MKYMRLIYSDPALQPVYGSEEFKAYMGEYGEFTGECESAGVMVGGNATESIASASKVTAHGGKTLTVSGPIEETKEHSADTICSIVKIVNRQRHSPRSSQQRVSVRSRYDLS